MKTVAKQQAIQNLEKQLHKCATHAVYEALIACRIDPVPITIYADESKNDVTEFRGWMLFKNEQSATCIGYCDDPWGKGWAYFWNSISDTQKGDFSASWFCKSIKEILDLMIQLEDINKIVEEGSSVVSGHTDKLSSKEEASRVGP